MTLKQFRNLLLTITDRVGHGEHFKDGGNYIVWHEVGRISLGAENETVEKGWRIAVDYFTKDEYDETCDRISALFDCDDIAADDPAVDYEPDTGYTTYNVCSPSASASTSKFYAEIYNASWGNRKVITTSDVSVSTGIGIYRIVVPSGVTLSNVTVYPMIVSSTETDTSFEAYTGDVNTRLAAIEAALGL